MRITNQMITGNSLRNMQSSMTSVNTLTQQLTSGKKISKASEDPVIAIRALKLRTTVSQLEQYKTKNIPDAQSWLDITTTSLDNITSRIKDVTTYCVQGSTDSFNTSDRGAIIDGLKALQEMIYGEGNATYAGRYIFSGFKTDRSLAFTETDDTSKYSYDITQSLSPADLDTRKVVNNSVDYNALDSYLDGSATYTQPDPETVYRLNLAYEGIDDTNNAGTSVFSLSAKDSAGNPMDLTGFNINIKETSDSDTYYKVGDDDINIIKETGEIILGENAYNTLKTASSIDVSYAKNEFNAGDLRPEHYFDCVGHEVMTDGSVKDVTYTASDEPQQILYEVNFNQSLQVNTEGTKIIDSKIGNYINDLIYSLGELEAVEAAETKLKSMLTDTQYANDEDAVAQINKMLTDIDVEKAVKKENMQKVFSANISNFQGYLSEVSAVQSDIGSRMSKLTMVETRVKEQYSTFKELKSTNEDVESDAAIIDFNEAELVYQSALAATGSIMTKTLLDYI